MDRPQRRAIDADSGTGPSTPAPNQHRPPQPPPLHSSHPQPLASSKSTGEPRCSSSCSSRVTRPPLPEAQCPPPPPAPTPTPAPAQVAVTVADAWDAYRAALRAGLRDHHSDTLAFAVRAFAKGTRATYLCAVRGTLQGTNNDDDVRLAIDSRLLLLGHRRRGGSVARNTVSGFQMLAKLQLIPEVARTGPDYDRNFS